ncbi:MAG: Xaa-Pro dipeptidase [Syntrophus sp. PtaU1.Bin208]|nr:MAG: Xaa-Pro dipeptidase [Syntrophus sp. PtaU1.Bin208]
MMSFHGYLNDQTRNFCIGEPPDRLKEGYALVREIHERFKEAAVPGTVTGELYDRVCTWVAEAGWADHFMGYGENRVSFVAHGLGLEVDEFPFIAQGQKLELQKGMIFAFEPKLIVPGLGITGLENTYLVTEKGLVSLNEASEEMVCV